MPHPRPKTDFEVQLEKELERTDGLGKAIIQFAETGSCSAAPPIFGALVRLGIYNNSDKEGKAYRYVQKHKMTLST